MSGEWQFTDYYDIEPRKWPNYCGAKGPHGASCLLDKDHPGDHWGSAHFTWPKKKLNRA